MVLILRAAALAGGIAVLFAVIPATAATDAFTAACTARGKASAAHCACESKLARGSLNAGEQAAMIRAMKGDTDGFRAAVAAMGSEGAQGFIAKMKKLQARTESDCR